MKYTIKSKPTEYNSRIYRSRLEARWAAYFDLAKIEFEYEPFDLEGWSPDFLINGNTLVEVKPVDIKTEFSKINFIGDCRELILYKENTFDKIINHFISNKKEADLIPRDYGCLILGLKNHGYYFKNFREKCDSELFQTDLQWFIELMQIREQNNLNPIITERFNSFYTGISEITEFDNDLWQKAGNIVQFLKPI